MERLANAVIEHRSNQEIHPSYHLLKSLTISLAGGRGRTDALTGHHGVRAVPLGVVLALTHATAAGLSLVGTQGLPLPLQTVLVPQVVLHVRLGGGETEIVCVCVCVSGINASS